jgi:hypothetical protein
MARGRDWGLRGPDDVEHTVSVFEPFQKIGRLKRDMVITEKIDGTNAQVIVLRTGEFTPYTEDDTKILAVKDDMLMFAGSRSRLITPTDDNFGFAKWVRANADELFTLGPGRHFGEWWGQGIQRGYGLTEKRFSLFNTFRHQGAGLPACCSVVPVLRIHTFDSGLIDAALEDLRVNGSKAAPGYMNPEGVIVYQTATKTYFKRTLDKDDEPKSKGAAA